MSKRYKIHSKVYERYENFMHIIEDTETGEAIIIDPAWDEEYFTDRAPWRKTCRYLANPWSS